jgi:hypothetical protein
MLAFVVIVFVIPIRIYAMGHVFLAVPEVNFWNHLWDIVHFFMNFWYVLEMMPS